MIELLQRILLILLLFSLLSWVIISIWKKEIRKTLIDQLLILSGIIFIDVHIKFSFFIDFRFGVIWIILGLLIIRHISQLDKYFINGKNLLSNIFMGILLGGITLIILAIINPYISIFPKDMPLEKFAILYSIETAVGEEMLFRSFIFGLLINIGVKPNMSILLQSLIFLLVHLPRYLPIGNIGALLFTLFFGLLSGYMTKHYKNVAGSIVYHWMINTIIFFLP